MYNRGDILTVSVLAPTDGWSLNNAGLRVENVLTVANVRTLYKMPTRYLEEKFGKSDVKKIIETELDFDIVAAIKDYEKFERIREGSVCRLVNDNAEQSRRFLVIMDDKESDYRSCYCMDLSGKECRYIDKVDLEPIGFTNLVLDAVKEIKNTYMN